MSGVNEFWRDIDLQALDSLERGKSLDIDTKNAVLGILYRESQHERTMQDLQLIIGFELHIRLSIPTIRRMQSDVTEDILMEMRRLSVTHMKNMASQLMEITRESIGAYHQSKIEVRENWIVDEEGLEKLSTVSKTMRGGNPAHLNTALKAMADLRQMLGLNSGEKIEISHSTSGEERTGIGVNSGEIPPDVAEQIQLLLENAQHRLPSGESNDR